MINRLLACYALVGLLPSVPVMGAQLSGTARWWVAIFLPVLLVVTVAMVVAAFRRRSIRGLAAAHAAYTLVAMVTLPLAGSPIGDEHPWLWWQMGTAVVCVGIWRGFAAATVSCLVFAPLWLWFRRLPAGGGAGLLTSCQEALFVPTVGLAITAVALGMIAAARAADALAERVYDQALDQALDEAVGAERARLDQIMHDDVMTVLTAAANAQDPLTVRATAGLATATLTKIDALSGGDRTVGELSGDAFARLVARTVRYVSPLVSFATAGAPIRVNLPADAAEVLLGAVREAVRNAVAHGAPSEVRVTLRHLATTPDTATMQLEVLDDGTGFELEQVSAPRLGMRVAAEALARVGAASTLRSEPGQGTTVRITYATSLTDSTGPEPRPATLPEEPGLPAEFPTGQLILITWLCVASQVVDGLLHLPETTSVALTISSMIVMLALTALVLRPGHGLRLARGAACLAVALVALLTALMSFALPLDELVDPLIWQGFPLQLIFVVLVIRRRPWYAVAAAAAEMTVSTAWAVSYPVSPGWPGLFNTAFGAASFLGMAVLVSRVLRTITARQEVLRAAELAGIEGSVTHYAAEVQRWLWLEDLRSQARDVLRQIASSTGSVRDELRQSALLVEAALRESLLARNVMSEELSALTDTARRRGIDVRFVDSRDSPVDQEVERAVLAEVRSAVTAASVDRIVVRLSPRAQDQAVSVLTGDAARTSMALIDQHGIRTVRGDGP